MPNHESPPEAPITSSVLLPPQKLASSKFQDVDQIAQKMIGFERVMTLTGDTYRDSSMVVIMPSRTKAIHHLVVNAACQGMNYHMNQKHVFMFCIGDEVGHAYNRMIQTILADPVLSTWKYVMTVESDNLPPPDAPIRLVESLEAGKFDAVSGIYFTKGPINMPMAYGDPKRYRETGELEFQPRDIRHCLEAGQVMEVNGIAMGCAVWRMDLFREVPQPWFVSLQEFNDGNPSGAMTQDLWFCRRARQMGKRFAVDHRVRVGHLDLETDEVY